MNRNDSESVNLFWFGVLSDVLSVPIVVIKVTNEGEKNERKRTVLLDNWQYTTGKSNIFDI